MHLSLSTSVYFTLNCYHQRWSTVGDTLARKDLPLPLRLVFIAKSRSMVLDATTRNCLLLGLHNALHPTYGATLTVLSAGRGEVRSFHKCYKLCRLPSLSLSLSLCVSVSISLPVSLPRLVSYVLSPVRTQTFRSSNYKLGVFTSSKRSPILTINDTLFQTQIVLRRPSDPPLKTFEVTLGDSTWVNEPVFTTLKIVASVISAIDTQSEADTHTDTCTYSTDTGTDTENKTF